MKVECSVHPTDFHSTSAMLPQHSSCQQIEQTHNAFHLVSLHAPSAHIGQKVLSNDHP
uniref:Protein NAM8 n=1 Tax=Rhizophora mucronata TaxID=61149 RepID=A0A2P2M2N3_RHIMU